MAKVILRKKREAAIKRFHPWIFSGGIKAAEGELYEGDVVDVIGESGTFLCKGHFHEGSIAVRVLSYEEAAIDHEFWKDRLSAAYERRKPLLADGQTNVYRLVHAAGDGLPGLIIDIYDDVAVLQAHTAGMHRAFNDLIPALIEVYGDRLDSIYDKSAKTVKSSTPYRAEDALLMGEKRSTEVLENGNRYYIDWVSGQKTGFFIDQRDNRALLGSVSMGKKVLNTFCYSGGFSVAALANGASLVHSVDSSRKAIDWTDKNVALNGFEGERHVSFCQDVFSFLDEAQEKYDLIVLDPPAFAKHVNAKHKAVQGYKRLNKIAMEMIAPGGQIFTFSCSQVIDRALFTNTVRAAGIEAGRQMRIVGQMGQGIDHPNNLFHPEGAYLKGLIVQVD